MRIGFFKYLDSTGTYHTSIGNIKKAVQFFKDCPLGVIVTGIWSDERWTRGQFQAWFHDCLTERINRNDNRKWKKLSEEYQMNLILDAQTINDYTGRRIRHSGCSGLLRTAEMQRRYPHINRQKGE